MTEARYRINDWTDASDIEFCYIIQLMDLNQLRHFVRIAELGSFSKAEAALNISQPSLSRQIRLLEDSLQTKLFVRTGRGVRLSPAGQQFFPHAQAILESVGRAKSALTNPEGALTGRILVGFPPRIARVLTPPLVEAFRSSFPDAAISIIEGMTPVLTEGLRLGRVEVAMLFNPSKDPQLVLQPLCKERFVLVGSKTEGKLPSTIRFRELAKFPLILPPMPNSIRALLEAERRRTRTELNVIVEVDTMQAIFDLIRRGLGFSIMPSGEVAEGRRPADLVVAEIGYRRPNNYVYLARSARVPATRLADELVRLIQRLDLPKLLGGEPA